ncbi:MAG: carboxypeptidase-like regulatory domain-containing protein, partial [Bacteroidota bacterium]
MGRLTSLAALMLILYTNSLQSQEIFSIAGKVVNQRGQPLPFATVMIESLGIGTVSDDNGNYLLEGIKNGRYKLTVNVLGFGEKNRTVTVQNADLTRVDFRLEEETKDLEEVVVKGKSDASKLQESAQAVTVVTTETLKLQTADLGEIMAKTEGVSVQRGG